MKSLPWMIALVAGLLPVLARAVTYSGIGTTSPSQLLSVGTPGRAGNSFFSIGTDKMAVAASFYSYGYICTSNTSSGCTGSYGVVIGPTNTAAGVNIGSSGPSFFNTGGGVGIGTNSVPYALTVQGSAPADWTGLVVGAYGLVGESNAYNQVSAQGTNTATGAYGYLGAGTTGVYGVGVAGGWSVIGTPGASSNGVLGYGAAAGSIAVEGYNSATANYGLLGYSSYGVYCAGGCGPTSWTNPSDRRLKRDIVTIDGALEKILQLRGVYYRWKDSKKDKTEGQRVGLVAQEVEPVFPQLVKKLDLPAPEIPSRHGKRVKVMRGMKVLAYSELVAPIVEGIKELNQKVEKNRESASGKLALERASAAREQAAQDEEIARLSQEAMQLRTYLCEKDAHAPGCQEPAHD